MLIRFIVMGTIIIIVCLVDLSHLLLDEFTERLLYFDDDGKETESDSTIVDAEISTQTENTDNVSSDEVEVVKYDLTKGEEEVEPSAAKSSVINDTDSVNSNSGRVNDLEDFEEDFANADEYIKEIFEAGDGSE